MIIWLVHGGELFPFDESYRPFRYSFLAEELVSRGHRVTRFTLNYNHFEKKKRKESHIAISRNYECDLVPCLAYKKNVSIMRLLGYFLSGFRFIPRIFRHSKPDLIVISAPPIEMAYVGSLYARIFGVPYIYDVRDLWPDILWNNIKKEPKWILTLIGMPWVAMMRNLCKHACCLTAVSSSYLGWAKHYARRELGECDRVFYLGAGTGNKVKSDSLKLSASDYRRLTAETAFNCIYVGQLDDSYDIEGIIDAVKKTEMKGLKINFLICGSGGKFQKLSRELQGFDNAFVLGWVSSGNLEDLYSMSHVGLACYASHSLQSIPNKPLEYLKSGVAVIHSLGDEFSSICDDKQFGMRYDPTKEDDLLDKIKIYHDDPDLLKAHKVAALKCYDEIFSVETIYPEFCQHIEKIAYLSKVG